MCTSTVIYTDRAVRVMCRSDVRVMCTSDGCVRVQLFIRTVLGNRLGGA